MIWYTHEVDSCKQVISDNLVWQPTSTYNINVGHDIKWKLFNWYANERDWGFTFFHEPECMCNGEMIMNWWFTALLYKFIIIQPVIAQAG